ncbi:hypothetical protein PMAYCL1PPCAC_22738, partial [Pristionchus mayeri]
EECADLATLAQVSSNFYIGVHNFMQKAENRPGIRSVLLRKSYIAAINMKIDLYPSNIPFHFPDTDRFKRPGNSVNPTLRVIVNGATDPVADQMSGLLSSCINHAEKYTSDDDFILSAHLLRNATFRWLEVCMDYPDDLVVPSILSLASHAKRFELSCDDPQLSDMASFITQLASYPISTFVLTDWHSSTSSYFGLLNSFWEKFLNEVKTFF